MPPANSVGRKSLGKWGEEVAAEHLRAAGYEILYQNYRTSYGEIDLIARKDQQLVFVEVKTRSSLSLGNPEISVTPRKQKHLLASIEAFLQENPQHQEDWRVDVVAIRKLGHGAGPEIVQFENAIC